MYNNGRPDGWGDDPGLIYQNQQPYGRPPPFVPHPGMGAFGSRVQPADSGELYGDNHEVDYRASRGGHDPGVQYGSRDGRHNRDFSDSRRDRHRRRSRSRSPGRSSHPAEEREREWDRGKRSSASRHSPPTTSSRGYDAPPTTSSRGGYDDDYRDHDRHRDRRPLPEDAPSKTVMLRNLPNGCFEAEIRHTLGAELGEIADIRVPRNTEGGNRGFGFIEFPDIATATGWMDQIQGSLMVNEQRVVARYSESREPFRKRDNDHHRESRPNMASLQVLPADWECARCGCNNFRHRTTCFRCEALRNEAEVVNIPSADDQVGLSPCNTLLLRNLDVGTDEGKISGGLMAVLSSVQVKMVKVVKDPRTNHSVGYAFVQLKSVVEATEMYNCLMRTNPPLTIDGKQVAVSFAKQGLNEVAQPLPHFPSSVPVASSSGAPRPPYIQGNNANSGAAVAQQALQQLHKSQRSANVVHNAAMHGVGGAAFAMPGYQYDAASGLYFEPNSRLYYDPKTQYFYNPETQQYLMWNAHTGQYVQVVGQSAPPPVGVSQTEPPTTDKATVVVDEKRKQAEKIVQDMEKWAKALNQKQQTVSTQNQKQQTVSVQNQKQQTVSVQRKAVVSDVKIGVVASVFKEDDEGDEVQAESVGTKLSYKSISIPGRSTAVPLEVARPPEGARPPEASGGDRDVSHSPPGSAHPPHETSVGVAEGKLIDWERFACLICKRQLQTKDLLQKHLELSDLHLRNLEAWRKEHLTEEEIEEIEANEREMKYRDRAKERRRKQGEGDPLPVQRERLSSAPLRSQESGKKRSSETAALHSDDEDASVSAPAPGLGSGNVGAKMMKAMGWAEGKGLGKSKQGIVDPVEARGHAGTSGLGASDGAPDILPSDTYANKVRKTMRQRFNQMQE